MPIRIKLKQGGFPIRGKQAKYHVGTRVINLSWLRVTVRHHFGLYRRVFRTRRRWRSSFAEGRKPAWCRARDKLREPLAVCIFHLNDHFYSVDCVLSYKPADDWTDGVPVQNTVTIKFPPLCWPRFLCIGFVIFLPIVSLLLWIPVDISTPNTFSGPCSNFQLLSSPFRGFVVITVFLLFSMLLWIRMLLSSILSSVSAKFLGVLQRVSWRHVICRKTSLAAQLY